MLDYQNAGSASEIQFERIEDVLTIKLPKEGFVRGAGNLLRLMAVLDDRRVVDLLHEYGGRHRLAWSAFRGRFTTVRITPERVTLFLLQPVVMICGYVLVVAETATTIRLYRTELVRTTHGFFGTSVETAHDRRQIRRVHLGWLNLSVERGRQRRLGCTHRLPLFAERTREERERVAAAIRTWLDERPAGL